MPQSSGVPNPTYSVRPHARCQAPQPTPPVTTWQVAQSAAEEWEEVPQPLSACLVIPTHSSAAALACLPPNCSVPCRCVSQGRGRLPGGTVVLAWCLACLHPPALPPHKSPAKPPQHLHIESPSKHSPVFVLTIMPQIGNNIFVFGGSSDWDKVLPLSSTSQC